MVLLETDSYQLPTKLRNNSKSCYARNVKTSKHQPWYKCTVHSLWYTNLEVETPLFIDGYTCWNRWFPTSRLIFQNSNQTQGGRTRSWFDSITHLPRHWRLQVATNMNPVHSTTVSGHSSVIPLRTTGTNTSFPKGSERLNHWTASAVGILGEFQPCSWWSW